MFNLPIENILKNQKCDIYNKHYAYSNGDCEIYMSHLASGLFIQFIKKHNDDEIIKEWRIQSVTKSSLKSLEKRISAYLIKNNIETNFYDVWDEAIYRNFFNQLSKTDIKNDDGVVIFNTRGEKYIIHINNLAEDTIVINGIIIGLASVDNCSKANLYNYMENVLKIHNN